MDNGLLLYSMYDRSDASNAMSNKLVLCVLSPSGEREECAVFIRPKEPVVHLTLHRVPAHRDGVRRE